MDWKQREVKEEKEIAKPNRKKGRKTALKRNRTEVQGQVNPKRSFPSLKLILSDLNQRGLRFMESEYDENVKYEGR